jgi:hypothetical protein
MFADTGSTSLADQFVQAFYQTYWATSFLTYKLLGDFAGGLVFKSYFVIARIFPFLCPTKRGDRCPRPLSDIHVSMTWPYFRFWASIVSNILSQPVFPKVTPLLFIYGQRKNIMFHTNRCLRKIEERQDCMYKSVFSGHWVQHEGSSEVVKTIKAWLEREEN